MTKEEKGKLKMASFYGEMLNNLEVCKELHNEAAASLECEHCSKYSKCYEWEDDK